MRRKSMRWGLLVVVACLFSACGRDDEGGQIEVKEGECSGDADCAALDNESCQDGEYVLTQGVCDAGTCEAVAQEPVVCELGCDGAVCAMPACEDVECAVPDPTCDGDQLITYDGATCVEGEGCVYSVAEIVSCEHGCQAGACVPAVCADVICEMPPPARCEETVAIQYAEVGTCVDDEGTARCSYVELRQNCSYTLAQCQQGACEGGVTQTGEAAIVEFMAQPRGFFGGAGQWFDVVNTSGGPLDLTGWRIESAFGLNAEVQTHELLNPPSFPAQARLLFAGSSDPAGDGSVTPDYQWSRQDLNLPGVHGWFRLVNADDEIVDFVYIEPGSVMRGHSRVFDPTMAADALSNDDFRNWCPNLTDELGVNFGRPGGVPAPCVAAPCAGLTCEAPASFCVNDLTVRSYDDTGVECVETRFNNPWCNFQEDDEDCGAGVCVAGTCEDPAVDLPEAGELVITELMGDPTGPDADREWVEIYNLTNRELSLFGLRLEDNETGGAFDTYLITDPDAVVAPQSYAVLVRNTDPTVNGGVSGGFYYNGNHLKDNPPTGMTISLVRPDGQVVTEVYYGTPQAGASQQLSATHYVGQSAVASSVLLDPSSWCAGVESYGAGGLGTPGAANRVCE